LIGLGQADRHLAALVSFAAAALQTLQKLIEMVGLEIEVG